MLEFETKEHYDIEDFQRIVEILRAPGGCPWDMAQTHESIRNNMLEEAYEAVSAIDKKDYDNLREELGDIQMQVLFHSLMEEEKGGFTFTDVCDEACKKLIFRHPHVFGDVVANDAESALDAWDKMKRQEKNQKSTSEAMDSVAEALPALWRAEKIQKKAAKVGFDWPDWHGARDKITEELAELDEAIECGEGIEEEMGDLLASCVNLCRFLKIDPEKALNGSNDRFVKRFSYMENEASKMQRKLEDMSLEEQDDLWNKAKNNPHCGI